METEPLNPEPVSADPVPLGYAGPETDEAREGRGVGAMIGFIFVLPVGLLFVGITIGLLADRITGRRQNSTCGQSSFCFSSGLSARG